jgi:hypothetical protein
MYVQLEMNLPDMMLSMVLHMMLAHTAAPKTEMGSVKRGGPMSVTGMLREEMMQHVLKKSNNATKGIEEGIARQRGLALELERRKLNRCPELLDPPAYMTKGVEIILTETKYAEVSITDTKDDTEMLDRFLDLWAEYLPDYAEIANMTDDEQQNIPADDPRRAMMSPTKTYKVHDECLLDKTLFRTKASHRLNARTDNSGVMLQFYEHSALKEGYAELVSIIEHQLYENGPTLVFAELEWLQNVDLNFLDGRMPVVKRNPESNENKHNKKKYQLMSRIYPQNVVFWAKDGAAWVAGTLTNDAPLCTIYRENGIRFVWPEDKQQGEGGDGTDDDEKMGD